MSEARIIHAIVLVLFLTICLYSYWSLFSMLRYGARLSIDAHWGGLGGGLGGWRISPALAFLILGTVALSLLFLGLPKIPTSPDLKLKYGSMLRVARLQGVTVKNFHVEGDRLIFNASATDEKQINRVWDHVKLIDPDYTDLQASITVTK